MQIVRWLNDGGWRVTADDRHAFAAGERWSPPPRLEFCDVILCVITPGWLVSDFCRHEFSYCAKRGRFVLPLICELADVDLLPPALRALPRVDLTQDRMIDYLALRQVLTQAGSQVARTAGEPKGHWLPRPLRNRRSVVLSLAISALVLIVTIGLWARS
jgi:hypothetical protein